MASYAPLDWSEVVIRIDGENSCDIDGVIEFAYYVFPRAKVYRGRSDTGIKYGQALAQLTGCNSWLFFSPNNDHVYINPSGDALKPLLGLAEELECHYKLPVVIQYSHFTEAVNSIYSNQYLYGYTGEYPNVIFENDIAYVLYLTAFPLMATHICRTDVLKSFMFRAGSNRVITTECLGKYVDVTMDCLQIIPKTELCRHYDGYMHTVGLVKDFVSAEKVPPLFIPRGFFDSAVTIKYGWDEYFSGSVNINPYKKLYVFEAEDGTDMGEVLSQLPLFWWDRVSHVDISPGFNCPESYASVLSLRIANPWREYSYLKIRSVVLARRLCLVLREKTPYRLIILIWARFRRLLQNFPIYLRLKRAFWSFVYSRH